ncbi:MAG: hypothetical protein OXK79_09000, partial [Chloroflexota bacterium]|nr:hypothetical protein [Chloroflexota bacterium]
IGGRSPCELGKQVKSARTQMPCDRIAVSKEREGQMDVKAAVKIAKSQVADLFADEEIEDIGLEEVELDDSSDTWIVTIGFSRPWDRKTTLNVALAERRRGRSYKVLHIESTGGNVVSLKDRILRDRN